MASNENRAPTGTPVPADVRRQRKTHLRMDRSHFSDPDEDPSAGPDAEWNRKISQSLTEEEEAILWGRLDLGAFVSHSDPPED